MTFIAGDAFNYSFFLKHLILSHNNLTLLSQTFLDNTPTLNILKIDHNDIRAIPQLRNHISSSLHANGNPLSCAQYGPVMSGCQCRTGGGLLLGDFCGYMRCTSTIDGCPPNLIFNSSNCSAAPWSSCVTGSDVLGQQFYSTSLRAFLPVTHCATSYPNPSGIGFEAAYE